ncbi:phage tail protein [Novosphingobium sp. KCTC 2891]|uniref:phage tail protein n=1 Tax=Novosphingobium sp. KCTC 2891 TaxID=2989730 RepID=UPI00222255D8|nr:phage tail protein [Novosphingobium sp. KCTC 2891]MCW1383220.1 phage tail protein [Novosphingobium sp. KCTC 2891]
MATLILTAVGTVLGGPLGGALGALVGRQVDAAVIGGRRVSGPRLKELSVQTSSYGTALPLHFGRMRAAGCVIWSTELVEHEETSGGGKGRPSMTSYSYTASFAVAVSSRPIAGIGRVWADGNLLRGAAGDLKVGGTMRVHRGHGDQPADPLLAQAEGAGNCPAHRGCAYVMFEDLELAEYGNRLPSLTFEIIADEGPCQVQDIAAEILPEADGTDLRMVFGGFTIDQGTIGDTLATIGDAVPLACSLHGERLVLRSAEGLPAALAMLPLPAASEDQQAEQAKAGGWARRRQPLPRSRQCGLRYYDTGRDYQPGLQRGIGRSEQGDLAMIELPASLSASEARAIADAAGRRLSRPRDAMTYRITEIDPAIAPGSVVRVPVAAGLWRVDGWEWQKDGVLLDLTAVPATEVGGSAASPAIDAGRYNQIADAVAAPTLLQAFELPWDGVGSGTTPDIFAAASGASTGWKGAALFVRPAAVSDDLLPLGPAAQRRAVIGTTINQLGPASPLLVDQVSVLEVQLVADDLTLPNATATQLFNGAGRALVGAEVIQFSRAAPAGAGRWLLSGLLRGRGGTEWAVGGHAPGEPFALLDARPTRLRADIVGSGNDPVVIAVGRGDITPAQAAVAGAGTTLRPLAPVHGDARRLADGSVTLTWVRRARGAWTWPDGVDTPLNEETEAWEIAAGDFAAAALRWRTAEPQLTIPASQLAGLAAAPGGAFFQVRQIGRGSVSRTLSIAFPA